MNDASATEWQPTRLAARLKEVESAARLIALLHHVPRKSLLVHPRWFVPEPWHFARAFLGFNRFYELVEADPRVKLIVNGQTHWARSTRRRSVECHPPGGDDVEKQLLAFDGKRLRRSSIA
jgi:hypothetical protein